MSVATELVLTAKTYAGGGYPPFLYFGRDLNGHLPAFCYHDIAGAEFESHLHYLIENGYRTLDADELVARLSGKHSSRADERVVALTFDDGLSTFYTTVYPHLRTYGAKALLYVAPAWIGRSGFLTWEQCREMSASGLVDVQSHSYAHAKVVTALRVAGVWRRSERSPVPWGVPGRGASTDDGVSCLPLLDGTSLFGDAPAFGLPDEFWQACSRLDIAALGRWVELKRAYQLLLNEFAHATHRVDHDVLKTWMVDDLRRSREAIETEIPRHAVRHFAFPWHTNSRASWEAAATAGFASAAIGLTVSDGSDGHRSGVTRMVRVSADFLPCLPGRSRSSFGWVLAKKSWRRGRGKRVYGIVR